MNWKLSITTILMGIAALFSFFGGGQADSASVAALPEETTTLLAAEKEAGSFEHCTYYEFENSDRYTSYRQRMPDLDAETVVWHVNAGLDNEPYTQVAEAAGQYPLLVNKLHRLPEHYEPAELVVIHSSITATPGTADAFRRMRAAAMQDGVFIEAAAGYRSLEKQQELFEIQELYYGTETAEEVVARPGHGEHSTGRALHIVDRDYTFEGFDQMPEYSWLMENCADYGFILRYGEDMAHITGFAYEPYHFTFVGTEIALGMKESGIATLEEYVARGLTQSEDGPIDDRVAVVIVTGYSGAVGDTYENDIALLVKDYLEVENVRVAITQDSEEIANETKVAALIGIDKVSPTGGVVAWFASGRSESGSLAETVSSRLSWSGLRAENRGIYEDEKATLTRLTEAPAVLIEMSGTEGPMSPDYNEQMAKSISDAVVAHLGLRKMYLTFDDGPSAEHTPKVLDILNEKGVKGTFFVVGEMAERNPEILRRIVDEGHAIGIHCYNHDYNDLYASVESFTADFFKAQEVVREITGIEPVIYRFPGGSINNYNKEVYELIIDEMNRLGFVYFDWNISSEDALGSVKAGELMRKIKEQTRYRNAVLLMHDAYSNIVADLGDIIDYFSDYQMDIIDANTAPVQF